MLVLLQRSLVPFLDLLSKVIGGTGKNGNGNGDNTSDVTSNHSESSTAASESNEAAGQNGEQQPFDSNSRMDETIIDQQNSLWGASSGIEWQGK
jgi:hypothetical protein